MKNTIIIFLFFLSLSAYAGNNKADKTKEAKAREWIKNQPLEFVENKGQFTRTDGKPAEEVLFKTSFGSCDIYITDKGLSYVFMKIEKVKKDSLKQKEKEYKIGEQEERNKKVSYYRLDMNLEGANISKNNIIKDDESKQGHYNYFYAHCPEGIYDVKGYGKITIKNIYKGIDWVIYTNSNSKEHPLKYDFVVHPGADYKDIQIKFLNAQSTSLSDNDTKLKIETIAGNIEEGNLYSYQKNKKEEIQSKYILSKDSIVSFEIADYDTTKTLVIDPLVWATYYGGNSVDGFTSFCVDSQNNIIITGYTQSPNFPVQILTGAFSQAATTGSYDFIILKFNNQGVRQWATYYGGNGYDLGTSVYVDNQDNIYVVGSSPSVNFPIQQLSGAYWQATNAGNDDIVIIKFNNQGVRLWATLYGGNGNDWAYSICVDSQDNIYITGNTNSQNFPTQQLIGAYWQANNAGYNDVFILKFSSQGVRLWATYYGGSSTDGGRKMCIDSQDNIFIIGSSTSQDFPTQQLTGAYWQPAIAGSTDGIILKFNNLGAIQWATYYGGIYVDEFRSATLDSHGNIFILGSSGSSNFPTQFLAGAYWQPNIAGTPDITILKFNNLGIREWATFYGGNHIEHVGSICIDSSDNIYITGVSHSQNFPLQFLTGAYNQSTNNAIAGSPGDVIILCFNNQGVRLWATYYGSPDHDFGTDIIVDHQNSLYVIGEFWGSGAITLDYGNNAYYDNSWNGSDDSFILKFNICFNQIPTSLITNRNNLCFNDNDSIILTAIGGFGDTLKWYSGGCGLNYIGQNTSITLPSPNQTTSFYARWESICDTSACDTITIFVDSIIYSYLNVTICQGDTFQVGTHLYFSNGTYSDTLIAYWGCDSIITTYLVVNPTKQTVLNPIICQGDSFQAGIHIYSITGIYKDTLFTYLGCDSIITTHLTVNPKKQITLNPVICQGNGFQVGIHFYTISGFYNDSLFTFWGCDSIITTHLTVNPTKETVLNSIICQGDSFQVGIHNYNTTGNYIDTLLTFLGCDSIITTNLTVNPKYQITLNPVICQGDSFYNGIHYYTISGIYYDSLTTYSGCDSIIITNLMVAQQKQTNLNPVICQGEIFQVGIHNYLITGTYIDSLLSYSGCDSIITTHITVYPFPIVDLGNDKEICWGELIELMVNDTYTSYLWQDGSTNHKYVVTQPGIYWVMINNYNCIKSDTITLDSCKSPVNIWIPNSFTPTGDGLNEIFKIETIGEISKFEMLIFNRWGQLIFDNEDHNTGWDGKYQGKEVQSGVYTYRIYIKDGNNNQEKVYNGRVTLIR